MTTTTTKEESGDRRKGHEKQDWIGVAISQGVSATLGGKKEKNKFFFEPLEMTRFC